MISIANLEKLYDISVIAFKITEGKIPVVYARGNHEIRGQVSELIGDYVGTNNGDSTHSDLAVCGELCWIAEKIRLMTIKNTAEWWLLIISEKRRQNF